ncbi:MAG: pentapeptide repeat-containing protein [Chloroflexi bacterium]|nr:MAG: pentapeptide repeat-containing protein [Chloroflexota bacterium]
MNADLSEADLSGARLSESNLSGASVAGVLISAESKEDLLHAIGVRWST